MPSVDAARENTQNLLSSGLQPHIHTYTHTERHKQVEKAAVVQ